MYKSLIFCTKQSFLLKCGISIELYYKCVYAIYELVIWYPYEKKKWLCGHVKR